MEVLQEIDVNIGSPRSNKAQLTEKLKELFSLESLSTDPSIVISMSIDLSVPLGFISNLEAIKRLSRDKSLIKECLKEARIDFDVETERIRPRIKIPRLKVRVRSVLSKEELTNYIDFPLEDIYRDSDFSWVITFISESEAIAACESLRNQGFKAGIENNFALAFFQNAIKSTYPALLSSAFYQKLVPVLPRAGRIYSQGEMQELFCHIVPQMPVQFRLLLQKTPVIRKTPMISLDTLFTSN